MSQMSRIVQRLAEDIKDLAVEILALDVAETRSVLNYSRGKLCVLAEPDPGRALPGGWVGISEMTGDQVRALLSDFPIEDEWVELVWPYENEGARMRYVDVVRYYDDLWFPSRDNLWITSERRTWLLAIDHEEAVAFLG